LDRVNALLIAAALTTAAAGNMAAMVGRDRVTATYPGFHLVTGDTTALAANGQDRKMSNGYGSQDAIVIRKVAALSATQAQAFGLDDALQVAAKYERREGFHQTVKLQPFANQQKITVCGHGACGRSPLPVKRSHVKRRPATILAAIRR
jgi:hypothetical protein